MLVQNFQQVILCYISYRSIVGRLSEAIIMEDVKLVRDVFLVLKKRNLLESLKVSVISSQH